jgi:hypothetical protein
MAIRLPKPRAYWLPIWEAGRFTSLTANSIQELAWLHLAADSAGYQLFCHHCQCQLPADFLKLVSSNDPEDPTLIVCNSCGEEIIRDQERENQHWDRWLNGGAP